MDTAKRNIRLLDCTLRDGGYYNDWDFDEPLIAAYLAAMASIRADYVELGFRSLDETGFKGGCAYTTDRFIERFEIPEQVRLGVMVNASELVQHPAGVAAALGRLFAPAADSRVALVRIASHFAEFEAVLPGCAWLKERGYEVGINLMQVADRKPQEIEAAAALASRYPLDVLYFADSLGSMDAAKTTEVIGALRQAWSGELGIHTHDNMGRAMTNSLTAMDLGVSWIDGTVTGMGRGAGNAQTEYLVSEIPGKVLSPALLSVISRFFGPLQQQHGWGANAFYYLAGKHGIHPSYVQEMLADSRYGEEDILAVIDHLRGQGGKKFSSQRLEASRSVFSRGVDGSWDARTLIDGREVLILGAGPSVSRHGQAIESLIDTHRPFVVALNTQTAIASNLIDVRVACHPVSLLADSHKHLNLPQPLITPVAALPAALREELCTKTLFDFGLAVQPDTFSFSASGCVVPAPLVIAYAMALAAGGGARRILLAGFDGYPAGDPRNLEMEKLLHAYGNAAGAPPLVSVTPSSYNVPLTSVYALEGPP